MKRKIKTYHEKFDKFYQSKEWQLLRNQKWCQADGLCEMCRAKGIIKSAKEIHHRIPIEEEWSKRLDYDNLVALCSDCHNAQHERISPLQKFLKDWDNLKDKEKK